MQIRNVPTTPPETWLTLDELQSYVVGKGRHWSRAYIYMLMRGKRLPFYKYGSTRITLRPDVDKLLTEFKNPAPPKMVKESQLEFNFSEQK